jgi:hypothetical protein
MLREKESVPVYQWNWINDGGFLGVATAGLAMDCGVEDGCGQAPSDLWDGWEHIWR